MSSQEVNLQVIIGKVHSWDQAGDQQSPSEEQSEGAPGLVAGVWVEAPAKAGHGP